MANLNISVLNVQGDMEHWVRGEDEIHLVYPKAYELGDTLVFTSDEVPGFYVIRVDGAIVAQMVNTPSRLREMSIRKRTGSLIASAAFPAPPITSRCVEQGRRKTRISAIWPKT